MQVIRTLDLHSRIIPKCWRPAIYPHHDYLVFHRWLFGLCWRSGHRDGAANAVRAATILLGIRGSDAEEAVRGMAIISPLKKLIRCL